ANAAVIMSALSLRPIFEDSKNTIISLVLANMFTLMVAYLIAGINSKKLVDPILTIKRGTEIIGAGNLHYTIDVATKDETEDLADSFNKMSAKLKELIDEVSDEKNKISAERNKFSIVFEGVLDGLFTLDFDRRITLFNKSAQEITGLTKEEVMGKKCDEVLVIFRNKFRLSASDFCPLTPTEEDRIIFEDKNLKLVTRRKELFVSMTSAVIKEGKSANLGCIVTFRDSSRERELEEMKLDFVSMAAHELRTPLTTIRGYLSVIVPRMKDRITDEELNYLDRVGISAGQLSILVENLLDVAKIEHNTLKLEIKSENWLNIVRSVVEDFTDSAKQKNVKLKLIEPEDELPDVDVDRFRISEVLANLVANAINFTEADGEVTLNIKARNGMVETYITDTGIGIPDRSIPYLFTKFYRVSGILEQGSKGTGLGLFICKSIVGMHHGEIWVESKLGLGSTFAFSIPASKPKKSV
ncbi:PAS domain-containing protein, partial [candidate division WWE3 bacterium]|nr:PAS domain-containing protein [candidate division WWE3 bacterium]